MANVEVAEGSMMEELQQPEVLVRALIEDEAEAITRKLIVRAKRGDSSALRCLANVLAQKVRPLDIGSPQTAAELAAAQLKIVAAVSSGRLTPREGLEFGKLLDFAGAALSRSDLEARLVAIETKNEKIETPVRENKQIKRLLDYVNRETTLISAYTEVTQEGLASLKDAIKPLTAQQQKALVAAEAKLRTVLAERSIDRETANKQRFDGQLQWRDVELAFDETDRAVGREPYRTADHKAWLKMRAKNARSRRKAPTLEEPPLPPKPVRPEKPPKTIVRPKRR